jgi:hypothetical protein
MVRRGVGKGSAPVFTMEAGEAVLALEERGDPGGIIWVRFIHMYENQTSEQGWCAKTAPDGSPILQLKTPQPAPAGGPPQPVREAAATNEATNVDVLVIRGVQLKASGNMSERGILSMNAKELRFKGAPTERGDGDRASVPIGRIREAEQKGGGMMMGSYYIELVAWKGAEGHATSSALQIHFGRDEHTCRHTLIKIQDLMAAHKAGAPLAGATPETDGGSQELTLADASALTPGAGPQPAEIRFFGWTEIEPGTVVYTVDCTFTDGRSGRTEFRYNQLDELRAQLGKVHGAEDTLLYAFPEKKWVGGQSAAIAEERRIGLEEWVSTLIDTRTSEQNFNRDNPVLSQRAENRGVMNGEAWAKARLLLRSLALGSASDL